MDSRVNQRGRAYLADAVFSPLALVPVAGQRAAGQRAVIRYPEQGFSAPR